jgi:hypothetical protein
MARTIAFEQAVYGSFPFWNRGYAVLARSAGCRDEWVAALKLAGQRFGEPPTGAAEHGGLFAIPLPRGPWMIVGVSPQGCDDQGRPGALAFHGLFVGRWSYRWAGASPFAFVPALRSAWDARDQATRLPAGRLVVDPRASGDAGTDAPEAGRVRTIAEALTRGRRVVVLASRPADDLARRVWVEIPGRVRRRTSLATWAYRNENGFDLVAVPRGVVVPGDGTELRLGIDPGELAS